ncbi:multidrug resistance-associated ABC transporter [Rhizoctonia solani 123E]|uniref:Multidrug resistance-associated ABC transporter n=1 Tax=Rhizoctonia solani 123E TaxID=1423351 RepID=A0A074RZM0_9AGAM|nr:multidrug resistance-associated ABC transporter [Rhizoctonia solani 123E]
MLLRSLKDSRQLGLLSKSTTPKKRMTELPPDIKACAMSATYVVGMVSGVGIPALIIMLVVLHAMGVRPPDLPILYEFINKEAIDAVTAEEDAEAVTKSGTAMSPDADFPNESSPLLERASTKTEKPPAWRLFALTLVPILEIAGWTVELVHQARSDRSGILTVITPAVVLVSWVYAGLRPNLRPSYTPYYDLLFLYFSQFVSACVSLYQVSMSGAPSDGFRWAHFGRVLDAFLTLGGITVILNMPLESFGKPIVDAEGRLPAFEDHCTLLQWITFSWVSPLVALGSRQPLGEKDMWQLSRLMRTRVLMKQFSQLKRRSSLLRKILAANARDLFLDLVLTVLSAILDFGPPVFLNLILRSLTASPRDDLVPSPSNMDDLHFYGALSANALLLRSPDNTATEVQRPLQRRDAYAFAVAAAICQLIKSQSDLQHLYFARRASVRIKGELVASIYEKALKRKDMSGAVKKADTNRLKIDSDTQPEESSSADIGKVVSLIAADAEWISRFVTILTFIYDAPVSAVISCFLLYNLMGWTAFVGYIALILTLPINNFLVHRTAAYQRSVSTMRDLRMQAMNEAIQGIKFIKYSAWESRWIQRVLEARNSEVKWLSKLKLTSFFMSMVWDLVPILVAAIGFSCFTLVAGRELTVDIAFPCISIFHILSTSLAILPLTVASIVRTLVSLQRIEKYLSEEEVPDHVSALKRSTPTSLAPTETRLGCNNATFHWPIISTIDQKTGEALKVQHPSRWTKLLTSLRLRKKADPLKVAEQATTEEDQPFTLRDISVVFPEGVLSLVCGPTGSGKSSLLSAVLGEMDLLEGELYLPKEPTYLNPKTGLQMALSYCTQQPWLEHKSIKDNILFGSPLDIERYKATLDACALKPDLALFEDRDETEIGEKGVSLSGGQKARVALARAVYARTQFVILDDILSAVDSHTAEHIVQRCLRGPLLRNRTVVLVTHHVDLVRPAAGWLIQMDNGRIEVQGSPQQLRESSALRREKESDSQQFPTEEFANEGITNDQAEKKPAKRLVEDEAQSTGSVRVEVYKTYLSAGSYWLFGLLFLFLALDQVVQLLQKFWIKHWGESYRTEGHALMVTHPWLNFDFPSASRNVLPYLAVYLIIQTSISLINVLSQIPDIWATLRATRTLYEKMLRSVMRSPTRFFDKTPSGRILNRFSKDIDTIDSGIQNLMVNALTQALVLIFAVGTIVYAVPYFIFPAVVIAYLHVWFSRGYVSSSRDLRRIEATTRSPIVASFSELLAGIVTVRAFGAEQTFLLRMYKNLDLTQTAAHYLWMCNRWLLLRFDFLGAFSVLIATTGTIMGGASAGLAGIVITQAQQYVRSLYFGLRFWTELEQSMNSVERIQEYLDLPSEPPAVVLGNRPPAYWPSATTGSLVVEDLTIKYAVDLEPVLKGISFTIRPSEKIGIVGRTGSGKSTLALALFRFTDPAGGKIVLDGIDITSIGLDDLRSKLTLIPQDAILFKGTIRDNLDPFKEYTDAECIEALKRVHLPVENRDVQSLGASNSVMNTETAAESETHTEITSLAKKTRGCKLVTLTLETAVSEGGHNFSHGQRQLLCMARALLRKTNVIVMDESTASVDFDTDAKIQTTIREEFKQSMLITIAHRLRTVIDNDRILVLDAGQVVEFDTPKKLLENPNGVFHEMCRKSGDYEYLTKTLKVVPK